MLLVYLCVAWVAGIWAGPVVSVPWPGAALISLSAFTSGLLWRRHQAFLTAGMCLPLLLLGQARYQAALPAPDSSTLSAYNGRGSQEILGWVSAEPEVRDRTTQLRLEALRAKVDGEWREVRGTALAITPRYPRHAYGQELRLVGVLEAPEPLGEFDYPAYLARQGVYSVLFYPRVEVLPEKKGFAPWGWLLEFKERLARNLAQSLPEPQAALAQGILLGLRASIPPELMEAFNRSGTTHIIVISGHNLTLLAGYLMRAGQPLMGRRRALWLSLLGISVYALLVGAQPPVVRAAIMAAIFILGAYLGRQRQALIGLALAAAAMTALQPPLLWDVSFQLSFAATAGLIFLSPVLQEALGKLWPAPSGGPKGLAFKANRYLIEVLAVTLAATLAVLPLLLVNFQRLSLVAPLANLLVLPSLPGIMLSGALTAGLGFLAPLGQVAGWTAWPFLTYMTAMVEILGKVPIASLEVQGFGVGLALVYYSVLGLALLWRPGTRAPHG
ncbi:MAG TPA: ComEC/Rec2 family competence protein [Dehalococcoidia bacterium]|nr:ComEC/Rec2 family competence protein [Dehalococcoidia bacterium]